jgi:hypothetical protein
MATTQLKLYNEALRILGARKLLAITDNIVTRRELDEAWDAGALDFCLEKGLWNFALRTVEAEFDPSETSQFGFNFAFSRPLDYIRLSQISVDERFSNPLLDYVDEAGLWWCDLNKIYISYVSNDTDGYGADYSMWPVSFTKFVAAYLAKEVREKIAKGGISEDRVNKIYKERLTDSRSKDAMEDPTKFPPVGNWRRSRRGRSASRSRWNGVVRG